MREFKARAAASIERLSVGNTYFLKGAIFYRVAENFLDKAKAGKVYLELFTVLVVKGQSILKCENLLVVKTIKF